MRADLGPQFGGFLGHWSGDGAALGLALVIYDHTGVVLAVEEGSVGPSPGSSLSDDDSGVHFLSQFLDSLLDGAEDDIADRASGQPIETSSHALDRDNVQVLCS